MDSTFDDGQKMHDKPTMSKEYPQAQADSTKSNAASAPESGSPKYPPVSSAPVNDEHEKHDKPTMSTKYPQSQADSAQTKPASMPEPVVLESPSPASQANYLPIPSAPIDSSQIPPVLLPDYPTNKPFADFKIADFEVVFEVIRSDGRVFKICDTKGGKLDTVLFDMFLRQQMEHLVPKS